METVKILKNGDVILSQEHRGNNKKSVAFYYFAFAKYALEKAIKNNEHIHWMKSRRSFGDCLPDINIVANYMGIDGFFLSLSNNTGGATYKYDQDILEVISPWGNAKRSRSVGDPPIESLKFLQKIGYRGYFYSSPPFQKIGDEGYYKISLTDGGVYNKWVDLED